MSVGNICFNGHTAKLNYYQILTSDHLLCQMFGNLGGYSYECAGLTIINNCQNLLLKQKQIYCIGRNWCHIV